LRKSASRTAQLLLFIVLAATFLPTVVHAQSYTNGQTFQTQSGSYYVGTIRQSGTGAVTSSIPPYVIYPGDSSSWSGAGHSYAVIDSSQVTTSGIGGFVANLQPVTFTGAQMSATVQILSTGTSYYNPPKVTLAFTSNLYGNYAFLIAEVSVAFSFISNGVYLRSYAPGACTGSDWCTDVQSGYASPVGPGSTFTLTLHILSQLPNGRYSWQGCVNGACLTATTYGAQMPTGNSGYWLAGSWPYGTTGETQNGVVQVQVGQPTGPQQQPLTMQVTPSGSGTTNPPTGTQQYTQGTTVGISATATSGYTFTGWSGSGSGSYSGTLNPATVIMNGPITETANFQQSPPQAVVTVNTNPSGAATPTGTGTYLVGTYATIGVSNIQPGYTFQYWTRDGVVYSSSQSFTYLVDQDRTFTAWFQSSCCIITFYINPSSGGSIGLKDKNGNPVNGGVMANGNSVQLSTASSPYTITANMATGYSFQSWTITGAVSIGSMSTTPTSLTVQGTGPGSVTLNLQGSLSKVCTYVNPNNVGGSMIINGQSFSDGGVAQMSTGVWWSLSANVPGGYKFDHWSTTGSAQVQSTTSASTAVESTSAGSSTCDGNLNLHLSPSQGVSITVTSNPTGSGFVAVDGSPISTPQTFNWAAGSTHTLTANSPVTSNGIQYTFQYWNDGGAQTHTITTPSSATTYTATFLTQQQTGTVIFYQNGIPSQYIWGVTVNSARYTGSGPQIQVTVSNLNPSYSYDSNVNGATGTRYSSSGCSGLLTVPNGGTTAASCTYSPQYQLTMQVNPSGSGSTSPTSGGTWWYAAGWVQAISATANAGYAYSNWLGSGSGSYSGTSSAATVTMNAPITETANFQSTSSSPIMMVSYQVNGGGSPSAPTFNYVQGGNPKFYTLTTAPTQVSVDTGSTWSVTPDPLGGSGTTERWHSSQPLSGTATTTTLVFTYQHQYLLTVQVNPSGSGSTLPTTSWQNAGAQVQVSAVPSNGYAFSSWTGAGSGSYLGTLNPATVTVSGPITETANFQQTQTQAGLDFVVFTSPLTQTIQPGESTEFTVTVLQLSGPPQQVSLSISGLPSGATIQFTPSNGLPTYSTTLTVTTTTDLAIGQYVLTIKGVAGSTVRSVNILLQVNQPLTGDFTLTTSPTAANTTSGSTAQTKLSVTYLRNYAGNITLSLANSLPGVSAQFNPPSVSMNSDSTVTITISNTQPGSYMLDFKGSDGKGIVHDTYFLLRVNPTDNSATFMLNNEPPSTVIPIPTSGTNTGIVSTIGTALNGYAGTVTITVQRPPFAVTVTPSPASLTLPSQNAATETISAQATASPSAYIIQAEGTDGSTSREADFVLILYSSTQGKQVVVTSNPAGPGIVQVDGTNITTPMNFTLQGPWAPGSLHSLNAFSNITVNGIKYSFQYWSDGGSQTHMVTAPSEPATYTAVYTQVETVLVNIVEPQDGYNIPCGSSIQIKANITDAPGGPGAITQANYTITGPNNYFTSDSMTFQTGNVFWSAYWDRPLHLETGTYALTVQGKSTTMVTGQNSTTMIVSAANSSCQPTNTYYINYAEGGEWPTSWHSETNFMPGETMGVTYQCPTATCAFYIQNANDQNMTQGFVEPNLKTQYPWLQTSSVQPEGSARAIFPIAGAGSAPPPYGTYQVIVIDAKGNRAGTFIITISSANITWSIRNGIDHATATATINMTTPSGTRPWLHREGTVRIYGTVNSLTVTGWSDKYGIAQVTIPYIDWQGVVTLSAAYGLSQYQLKDSNNQAVTSNPIPYQPLGIASQTSGTDYLMNIQAKLFLKNNPATLEPGWVTLQIPQTNQWVGMQTSLTGGSTTIQAPPSIGMFTVQAWAYSLDETMILPSHYADLELTREQAEAVATLTSAVNGNGQLTVSGIITLNSQTMTLTNVQLAVQVYDAQGHVIKATTQAVILQAGQQLNEQWVFQNATGASTVRLTVTYLTTQQVIGSTTRAVTAT
jgi:hypothetical protein